MSLGFVLFDVCYILFQHIHPLTATYTVRSSTRTPTPRGVMYAFVRTLSPQMTKRTHTVCAFVFLSVSVSVAFSCCGFVSKCCHPSCQRNKKNPTQTLRSRPWILWGFCVCLAQLRITVFTAFDRRNIQNFLRVADQFKPMFTWLLYPHAHPRVVVFPAARRCWPP